MPHIRNIPLQAAIAFDQFLNTLVGGWADETFSARCWRQRNRNWFWRAARRTVDTLLFFDRNHCEESYKSEQLRLQSPPEQRPPAGAEQGSQGATNGHS